MAIPTAGSGGSFDSRATTTIDGDARPFLRAQAQVNREMERASAKREAEIARQLAATGKLTQENFNAAKAIVDAGGSWEGITKQVGLASKAVEVLGTRVKAVGMSILSGFGAGIVGGVLGGSVSSLIQKAFEPPSDTDLQKWIALGEVVENNGELLNDYARSNAAWAKTERDARAMTALRKQGLDELKDAIESITHEGALKLIANETSQLNELYRTGKIDVENYTKALHNLDLEYEKAKGRDVSGGGFTASYTANRVPDADEARLLGMSIEEYRRRKGIKEGRDRKNAAREAIDLGKGGGVLEFESLVDYEAKKAHASWLALQESIKEANRLALTRAQPGADLDEIQDSIRAVREGLEGAQGALKSADEDYKAQSPLERLFGPADQFSTYRDLFVGFTDAVGASYEALVTGSESAGVAFRKAISGMLVATGKQNAVKALEELALAWSNPTDAARHLTAAAKHGAVAVAAGVAAAALGGGGGAGGGSGGGGGAPSGGGGFQGGAPAPAQNPGTHPIIFVNDPFSDLDSPRSNQAKFERVARRAGYGMGPNDPRFN